MVTSRGSVEGCLYVDDSKRQCRRKRTNSEEVPMFLSDLAQDLCPHSFWSARHYLSDAQNNNEEALERFEDAVGPALN